jgi:hypothetical protein
MKIVDTGLREERSTYLLHKAKRGKFCGIQHHADHIFQIVVFIVIMMATSVAMLTLVIVIMCLLH